MQEIEWQLYTPFERNDAMRESFANSVGLIDLVNQHDVSTP
jgi:hypothetical protein